MAKIPDRARIEVLAGHLIAGKSGDQVIAWARKTEMSAREINEVFRTAKAKRSTGSK